MPPGTAPSPFVSPDAIRRLLMQGGDPSTMLQPDPSQPQPSTAAAPTPTATTQSPPAGSIAQSFAEPQDKQAYLSEHPVPMAARPRGDFDKVPDGQPGADTWGNRHNDLRHVLASLFAGTAEFGGDLNHHPGAGAPFTERWMGQSDAQRNYDQNLPVNKQNAENASYDQYLGQSGKAGEITKTGAETENLRLNNPAMQRKAQFLTQLQGDAESGKYDPAVLKAKYLRIAQYNHVNVAPEEIDTTISGTKPLGSKYTLTRDTSTQAPVELVDRQGNHYSASNLPKDPEAQQMWNDASTAAGQKVKTEEDKEKRVAGYAADRQAAAFSNQETAKGRELATKHLNDMRSAQNQLDLVNKLASSKSPTDQTSLAFKALGLDLPDGVHRINEAELNSIKQQGSLSDRAYATLLNWKSGEKFAPDILEDIKKTATTISQSKIKNANDNLEDVNRTHGYKAPGSNDTGRFDKPEDYQSAGATQPGGKQAARPKGATHTGIGSDDKKKHWLDAKGNDLGLAE